MNIQRRREKKGGDKTGRKFLPPPLSFPFRLREKEEEEGKGRGSASKRAKFLLGSFDKCLLCQDFCDLF